MPHPRLMSWGVTYTAVRTVSVSEAVMASWLAVCRPVTSTVAVWARVAMKVP